ncbi:MAG: hypothetical protein RL198_861 [Actinomycetota bacterium]
MTFVGFALWWLLQFFVLAMFVRFIADFITVMRPGWRPNRVLIPIFELAFTITDPPIKFVRRFLPPLRLGGIALDLAWTAVLLAALFLQRILGSL